MMNFQVGTVQKHIKTSVRVTESDQGNLQVPSVMILSRLCPLSLTLTAQWSCTIKQGVVSGVKWTKLHIDKFS